MKPVWKYIFTVFLFILLVGDLSAQQPQRRGFLGLGRNRREVPQVDTSTLHLPDSVIALRDSLHRADSIARRDSLDLLGKSSLERPAFSTAKDSIVEVFSDGQRKIYYYGGVTVQYQNMELTADFMEYDMNTGTVFARGRFDPISEEWIGQPEMKQDGNSYKMEELRYNFNTRKALIKNMVTKEDEGILQGRDINMAEDQSISLMHGMYTVCDLEHPHYWLNLYNAKVITRPSQKTVFGPAWPTFEDVPFPIGLPFGFIPKKPQRATGLLMPTFGEENARGFYFRDMGMYFVIGDYFDLSMTGDIYTLGSWSVNVNSRYKVNYKFNGNFAFNYSNDQSGERGSTDFFQSRNFGVKWSHQQDSKMHPGTSFSASVNFSSPSNSRYNSRSVQEALQNQMSSSVSYSHNWNGKFNLSINALHSQNSRDTSYAVTLPNVTFSVNTFYPFKQKNRVGKEKIYEKISFGYNTAFQNKVNFKGREFAMNRDFMDKFQSGMNHNFSIGLPAFTLFKYLNFSPGVSYGQNWFFRKTEKVYDPETDKVVDVDSGQFGTFGITQDRSYSISGSTRLYGMFNFGKHRRIQAIRHVITPSISASYSPELGTKANGWRTLEYTDASGNARSLDYNVYAGQMNSPPGKGKNGGLSFSFGNNLEAKVRDLRDTTGTGSKKVKLIDQLTLNGSYNFLAEEFKMSNIGISMSTSVFGKISLNGNINLDPYATILDPETGRATRINRFNVLETGRLFNMTNGSASVSYSLSGKGATRGDDGAKSGSGGSGSGSGGTSAADSYKRIYYHPITGEYIPGGYVYYMNTNAPWSVSLSYSFNYSRSFSAANNKLISNNRITQTIQMNGNVKLTPRLSLQLTSGFDVMAARLTTTQIAATYDLHCFNISVSWVPTGNWQSYSFIIAANAASLADLLRFKKSSSYMDNMMGY